ncbi:SGNH/GDSL hydrolase family protein [Metabacillus litoralis]|uniref:SGNH/GDSL hydrolase family protein n=1 Tax=Metabacillus litoralis TaxID=152268 RepID=UPI00203FBED5|nr:SGNH/GDSL hydrolase family protein [Metabacillus litoralis]MCM3410397.1 SGNH/GDSL hydrolase family protein [Metabacillus litoralis]
MQRLKVIVTIASLLVVCFSLYFFLSHFNQTKQSNIETSIMNEATESVDTSEKSKTEDKKISEEAPLEKDVKIEDVSIELADEEKKEIVEDENNKHTITEGIKEKVKEAVEGVIKLFEKDLQVVAIGDSLTQGVGDETKNGGYVGILNTTFENNNIKVTIENYGKRGNRTDQLLKRLEKKEIEASIQKADIVLVTIGANDIMKIVRSNFTNLQLEDFEKEEQQYIERLTAIFSKINELNPNSKIYYIGFYNPFDRYFPEIQEMQMIVNDWNEIVKSITEDFENVNYIPIADLFSNSDVELLSEDYFHPNTTGYKLMAKRILESMEEVSVEKEAIAEDEE